MLRAPWRRPREGRPLSGKPRGSGGVSGGVSALSGRPRGSGGTCELMMTLADLVMTLAN